MKKFALNSIVLSFGALAASAAFATVDLDATPAAAGVVYANEIIVAPSVTLLGGAAADQTASTQLGASFGDNVTAYIRVDVAGGTLGANPVVSATPIAPAVGAIVVTLSQSGPGFAIYALTPAAGERLDLSTPVAIDTSAGGVTVTGKAGVTLRYRLYESLTAAANPTALFALKDSGVRPYIAFANSLVTTVTASAAKTADVAAIPSYTAFTNSTGSLARVNVAFTSYAEADGSALTIGELLAATNSFTFNGDFAFTRNDDLTYTGAALNRVFLNDDADCTAGVKTIAAASTLSASSAVFSGIAAAVAADDHYLCVTPEGTPEISVGSFTADLDFVSQAAYAVSDLTGAAAGSIVRNGVRMVAPLAQTTAGYVSRLVMNNTGSTDRQYTVTTTAEDGTTVALSGAAAGGTLVAGKTLVIDLSSLMTVTGPAPRASLIVTVNAPQSEIDGLLQLGNPTTGAFTNHILSYK